MMEEAGGFRADRNYQIKFPSGIDNSCVFFSKLQVKCALVQALRLCTGRTAHRGSRGIALPFRDHGTRRG